MAKRFHSAAVRVNGKTRRAIQRNLLRWYRRNHRPLPWRQTRDPYKIWVSEIMLQQTRVEVARSYYTRWLRAFPSTRALARAPYSRVLKLWEGLGYYSRAQNLHRAAKEVMGRHHGKVPRTAEELRRLPGIGRYTAGAIASIAFDQREPLVDGNVARVLARVFCIRADVKASATQKLLWATAGQLVPASAPGEFNQALMELGALVCTPARPQCSRCPLRGTCLAHARDRVEQIPMRGSKPKPVRKSVDAALVRNGDRILLQRRPANGLLANLWELPAVTAEQFRPRKRLLTVQHTITNRRITMRVLECRPLVDFQANGLWRWFSPRHLERVAMPAAHRRALRELKLAQ